MDVGTVVEQLDAHARREVGGQALSGEGSAGDGLSLLTDEQREGVLTLAHLTEQIDLLGLNAIVGSLGTLHCRGTIADAVLVHELHLLPGILGELFHIGDNLHLTVEHQQRIVEVGDARDDVGLHHRLVVLRGDELHLSRALRTEQVAEEIDIPAGTDGQLVGLGGLGPVEGGQRALRTEHQ